MTNGDAVFRSGVVRVNDINAGLPPETSARLSEIDLVCGPYLYMYLQLSTALSHA